MTAGGAVTTPVEPAEESSAQEQAVLAAVLGLLAVGASALALAGALARLLRVRRSAAAAALSVVGYRPGEYRVPFTPAPPRPERRRAPAPLASVPGQEPARGRQSEPSKAARDITGRAERHYRAAFMMRSTKRIEATLGRGRELSDAVAREKVLWELHREAALRRRAAAARVDDAVDAYGLVLSWRAVLDKRTTPDCHAANGLNFRVDRPPRMGFPGAAHPRCRCVPAPPRPGAGWVDSAPAAQRGSGFERQAADG